MNYDNVKLWFAKNEDGNVITISDINENNKHDKYSCPMCGSDLIAKATKSTKVTSHFAHVDASKCSESMIHWWFKHKFLEKGDTFAVVSDKERQYIVKEVFTEQSYGVDENTYKPDVTVLTECGNTIYFEMAFSNYKKVKDYLDIWLELKNIVVEVDIKTLMDQDKIPTFKALFYDGKCFNVKKNDTYYNTIGKYKEEKLQGEIGEELKVRIQKLDWLWDDIYLYKDGKLDIEYMVDLIDNADSRDKELVDNILRKSMCNGLYEDYKIFKSLDDLHEYYGNFEENSTINDAIELLNKKYTNIYLIKLHKDPHYDYISYYKGSRKHRYASKKIFSHYTYTIFVKYRDRIIERVRITNRINKSFYDIDSVYTYLSNIIDNINFKCRCVECNKNFDLDTGEMKFFIKKELNIPRRCKPCRRSKRETKKVSD